MAVLGVDPASARSRVVGARTASLLQHEGHAPPFGSGLEYLIDQPDPSGAVLEQLSQLGDLRRGEMLLHLDK
jgi:hypothetical protein